MAAPDPVTWFQHRLILVAPRFPWFSGSGAWFWQALTWRCRASRAPAPGTACFGVFPVPLELPVVPTRGGASFSGTGRAVRHPAPGWAVHPAGPVRVGRSLWAVGRGLWAEGWGLLAVGRGLCVGRGVHKGCPLSRWSLESLGHLWHLEFWVLAIELRVSSFCYQELRKLQSNM